MCQSEPPRTERNRLELLAVVAPDDPVGLRLVGGVLRGEAGVGLLAGAVPGVEVLPHAREAALFLGARPHPTTLGRNGRQTGLLGVLADTARGGARRLGGVLGDAAVHGHRLGQVGAFVAAGVPAQADHDGDHAHRAQTDGDPAAKAAAVVHVASPTALVARTATRAPAAVFGV